MQRITASYVSPVLLCFAAVVLLFGASIANATNCRVSVVGAGFGGLYGAFRLQNDSTSGYLPSEICVFEKSNRVGGRALTAKDAFPTLNKVSLGAHRWDPDAHLIVDAMITQVLNLPYGCASHTQDCEDSGSSFFDLRNKYTGDLSSSNTPGFPYKLNPSEKFKKKDGFQDPIEEIVGLFPIFATEESNLASLDPAVRYPAIQRVTDAIRNQQVDGLYPNQLVIRTAVNKSSEYWNLYLDAIGEAQYFLQINVYDAMRDVCTLYASPEKYRVITDNQGHEVGYQAKDEGLASLLQSKGVSLQYNKELVSLKRNGNSLTLGFSDGTSVTSEKVLLNIPITSLLQLSRDSVIFTEANSDQLKMFDLISPVPSVKAFGYYPDAWWVGPDSIVDNADGDGEVSTTRPPNYYSLTDSAVECEGSGATRRCRGWVNMAYPGGDFYKYFRSIKQDPHSPMVVIEANTSDPMLRKFFYDFNYHFVESLCNATDRNRNHCRIPPPSAIVLGIWDQAWHDILPSNYKGGSVNNATLTLAQGVYWGNEANSRMQGWAEGSAMAVEQILHYKFGLNRPSWLGNQYWYTHIVENLLY